MRTLREVEGKIFDGRFDWSDVDVEKAKSDTRVLELAKEACLIEGYFAVYTGKMMTLFWDDVDATSIFTIEAFEAYTHYYTLRRYLDIVGSHQVTDQMIVDVRAKAMDEDYSDKGKELVNFMATEKFAAHFFDELGKLTEEPVFKSILAKLSLEEVNHSDFAFDLLERMIEAGELSKDEVHAHSNSFKHVGAYALPQVSSVTDENLAVIIGFDEQIRKLTGKGIADTISV